jgi:ATP-dependent RNA helicase DHX37/DHR1
LSSSLQLQSSSTLGAGKTSTAQERLEKSEDKQVRRAVHSRQRRGGHLAGIAESDSDEEPVDATHDVHSENDTSGDGEGTPPRDQVVEVDAASTMTRKQEAPAEIVVGSALQRNADGSTVEPRIMRKKGARVRFISIF